MHLTSVHAVSQRVKEVRERRTSVFTKGIDRVQAAMKDNRASRQARLLSLKQTDKEIEKLSTVWQQVKWNGHSSASGAWGRGEGLPRACVQARARSHTCAVRWPELGLGL